MKNRIIKIIFLLLFSSSIYSQTYYGNKDFGKLEFVNDTLCKVSFTSSDYIKHDNVLKYKRNCDTIWLSSDIKTPYKIKKYDSVNFADNRKGDSAVLKQYRKSGKDYKLINEYLGKLNISRSEIIFYFSNTRLFKGDIIVFDILGYKRLRIETEDTIENFTINLLDEGLEALYIFDEFPLLIKDDKIIPIDYNKNELCWLQNGFYFPTMKKSKKDKSYKTIGYWAIGLIGLPNGFNIEDVIR